MRAGALDQLHKSFFRPDALVSFLDKQAKYVLLLPSLILLAVLFAYPLAYTISLSVHDVNLFNIRRGGAPYVGLEHYVGALTNPEIWHAIGITVVLFGISLIIQLILGMGLAIIFNRPFAGRNLLMTICLIPMMITPIAVGMFWRLLLNAQWGVVNYFLGLLGLARQPWLGDTSLVHVAVVGVYVWWEVSFVFLVFLGGLTSLPTEPFEAASIDGASGLRAFRSITLPMMVPVILVVVIMRVIDAFRAFDIIYALTEGGPGNSTRVIALELYEIAFRRNHYSEAAALAILMSLLMIVMTALLMRALGYRSNEDA